MDKAQELILTLILMAVMYVGRAVYERIKLSSENKNSRPQSTIKQRVSPTGGNDFPRWNPAPSNSFLDFDYPAPEDRKKTDKHLSDNKKDKPSAPKATKAVNPEPTTVKTPVLSTTDIRQAVIWSEILKRKY